ncbi:unnamed protein product [Rotaria magnacalcarata]|nr:unnamed protein product [Rotaria magnacalcarata]
MEDNLIELLSSVLQRNKTIKHISLITNKIGDRGAQVLASLIKDSKMLISLDLRSNLIGDQGAGYLADALMNNTTLTKLKLRGNEIGPSGTKYLIDAQQNRTTPVQLELNGTLKLQCPWGHRLELWNSSMRKEMSEKKFKHRRASVKIECDICSKNSYHSWYCPCSMKGFDICEECAKRND